MNKGIIRGNQLITEFMSLKKTGGTVVSESGIEVSANGYAYNNEFVVSCELRYHSSWDWVMPVVEKIEKQYYTELFSDVNDGYQFFIYSGKQKTSLQCIAEGYSISKIKAVWLAIIEFIVWYIKQNENNETN